MRYLLHTFIFLVLGSACTGSSDTSDKSRPQAKVALDSFPKLMQNAELPAPFNSLKLPKGFKINYFAENVENARSLEISPSGIVYVGTRKSDKVYALVDEDQDGRVDKKYIIDQGLNMPNGVAFRDGDLFVAEVNRILKYENIEDDLIDPPQPIIIYDQYPTETHHGWKYIAFGPDGKLYVPVGAPCNICESEDEIYASITRIDVEAENPQPEVIQHGVRNTVGFTWHPETKNLWFTDNGRDWFGDDRPACELNHAPEDGLHFGYPYCHQGDLLDDEFGAGKKCSDYVAPAQNLGPHVAPLGVEFVNNKNWPEALQRAAIMAEHGSWNRTVPIGYRITAVTFDKRGKSTGHHDLISGWLEGEERWGRPVDMEWMEDGSLLISDDYNNAIYRVTYAQ